MWITLYWICTCRKTAWIAFLNPGRPIYVEEQDILYTIVFQAAEHFKPEFTGLVYSCGSIENLLSLLRWLPVGGRDCRSFTLERICLWFWWPFQRKVQSYKVSGTDHKHPLYSFHGHREKSPFPRLWKYLADIWESALAQIHHCGYVRY